MAERRRAVRPAHVVATPLCSYIEKERVQTRRNENMGPLKRENPNEPDILADEVQRGFDESGKLPDRLKRYALARKRALLNVSEIDHRINALGVSPWTKHLEGAKPKIATCGDILGFKHYYTVGKVRLSSASFCKNHLLCPLCAIRRGSKTLEAYLKRYEVIRAENPALKLSMLTLTVKNGDDLSERFNHLKTAISKLLERRRKARKGVRGWHSELAKVSALVGSIEITKDGAKDGSASGWHPHCHIAILHSEWIDVQALKDEWLSITGDSHVLRIDPALHPEDPAQDFLEVFKYALKFSDLTPEQNLDAYEVMRGKHLLFQAGAFRGVEIPEELTDTPLDDLPYVELLYQYLPGSGYNLVETRDSEDVKPGKDTESGVAARRMDYRRKCSGWSPFDHFEIPADIVSKYRRAIGNHSP